MSGNSTGKFSLQPLAYLVGLDSRLGRVLILLAAVALTFLITALFRPSLNTLEESLGALGWTLAPVDELEQRITIVEIDERSLAAVGPWPWTRQPSRNSPHTS